MPFVLRYSNNDTGAITFTGNTLGLSRSGTEGVPGTRDFIGAFVTVDTSLQFGSYPPGTTNDFNQDSASAVLRLPEGSKVLYAELVWAGTYAVTNGTNNFLPFIDKNVFMTTPQGTTFSIAPDPATAQISHRNATDNYLRSADVTALVQAGGAGTYTVGAVVGNIDLGNSTANSCGWTLCVVYEDTAMPFRNLSLNVGIVEIATGSDPSVTTTLTGFATPSAGPVTGRIALCAQDGDANKVGDQVLFGPTEDDLTVLSGPNNFPNNFFASQINDDSGFLDTSGTFGDRNQINGEPGTQIVGGRQSWDITNVDISETLTNGQTSAVFQLRTVGDGYSVLAVGIYIDINSPRITVLKAVDAEVASIGQVLTYTVIVENSGTVPAQATFLLDALPNDTTFVPGSVTVRGVPVPGGNPVTGVSLGTIEPGESIVVTYQAVVASFPPDGVIANEALIAFEYESVPGGPIFTGDIPSNEVTTTIVPPVTPPVIPPIVPPIVPPVIPPVIPPVFRLTIAKTADRGTAAPGDTVHFQITVTNSSNAPLTQVVVTDALTGFHQVIPQLPAGASASFAVSFIVPPNAANGSVIVNVATASSDQTPSQSAEASVNVVGPPPLGLAKSAKPDEATAGTRVTYTVDVANVGHGELFDVRLSDVLPAGLRFEPNSVRVNHVAVAGAEPQRISLGTIPPGKTVVVSFVAIVQPVTTEERIANQASALFRVELAGPEFRVESNVAEVEVTEEEE